ncbi:MULTISPECIES: phosphoadenosine phosphosulfate reductase family protein [Piscinibacter]|uniref:phosphoadenosine phosphosulfate reductase domain-containing protein n=1 Tax=Piscinibacter TaxID=1114981 RepID=UPI001F0CCE4B|nr:phosphoadenosine phosphosulfate reductase family protein [Piscinibacter defluvii]
MNVIKIHRAEEVGELPAQADLFGLADGAARFALEVPPEVGSVLDAAAPVFIGVSGGRDSQALAYRICAHLDDVGHSGQRFLIHAHLGRVEWRDSLPVCERLAQRLGVELVVVRRQAGDMMDRWLSRWAGNVARYADLECVKLIMPWSSASQRFCTSELKSQVLAREMRRRFPHGDVVSAVGIRREESARRAQMPAWKRDERLTRKRGIGHTWNAILGWRRQDVNDYVRSRGDLLHEAYRIYGSTRVSCAFCVMGSEHDLRASSNCADNHEIYREMVELEVASTFSFQSNRWLGDVAPDLLDASLRARLLEAKERARTRVEAESRLPEHLLFVKGWPTVTPTAEEAELIACVRRDVAVSVGLQVNHTDRDSVLARYQELIAAAVAKASATGLPLEDNEGIEA